MNAGLYSLWQRPANGQGGWEFICHGTAAEVIVAESYARSKDPDWQTTLLICEPGEGPELLREQGE